MKQLGELKAIDIMTHGVVSISEAAPVREAIGLLDETRLNALPVLDSAGDVIGILAVADLVSIFGEVQADLAAMTQDEPGVRDFYVNMLNMHGDDTRVRDVMTSPVHTIEPETNIVVAAQLMCDKKCHHLPVVAPSGEIQGVVSTSDFVTAFAEHGASLAG